ncbi:MAG: hypothetical protein DYH13_09535 [Alphaproteobacteria bacterium PRO2]|nr:hypothetical protein [Alphaproteobacteria bacterium PRO2]
MAKATQTKTEAKYCSVDSIILGNIVKDFRPDEIGLSKAWEEFYLACQAANASHELLRAIHDIKESIEDAEQCA